jgi:hypothetical protein
MAINTGTGEVLKVMTSTLNATSTIEVGQSGQSKISCLVRCDDTGAVK